MNTLLLAEWKVISSWFLEKEKGIHIASIMASNFFTDDLSKSLRIYCNNSALAENGHNDLIGHHDLMKVLHFYLKKTQNYL